jgi:serine kinase of HPr protein (carbohydrate metabolism regulator)
MKVQKLIDTYDFELLTDTNTDVEIKGIYSCDLLSWVMANGEEGNAWITVQTHQNILAVASLIEFSCIILPIGVTIDQTVIEKATKEGINILKSNMKPYDIYELFIKEGIK